MPQHPRGWAHAAGLLVAALLIAAMYLAATPAHTGRAPDPPATITSSSSAPAQVSPRPVTRQQLADLPEATTFTTLKTADSDEYRHQAPSGRVVHPRRRVAVYTQPGGRAIAALPTTQLGSDTWLPVIDDRPGWVRVLLPTRPNSATGWLAVDGLRAARTPYRVEVDRQRFRLTLYRNSTRVDSWTIGTGKPAAPTPPGRTFLLAAIRDTKASFSDIVLPLGAHSDTYTSYGGGPGTVGIHTWPTANVYGAASSDGCLRVPRDALDTLSTTVPLGTPVLIT